jgi:hypothetical protein
LAGGERGLKGERGTNSNKKVEREIVTKAPKQKETDTKLCVLVLEL